MLVQHNIKDHLKNFYTNFILTNCNFLIYDSTAPQQKLLLLDYNILDHLCTLVNSPDPNIKKNAFACLSITTELGNLISN